MLGPIFYLEMLLGGRRGRGYYLRWFIGGLLILQLIGFTVAYQAKIAGAERSQGHIPGYLASDFALGFMDWVVTQQYLIVLLATPVFTAGAVTDEKTRGTLLYLFSADLSAWEILIGKLLGRAFEVVVLLLTTLPFVCFIGVWGGLTPPGLLALCLSLLGPVFAVGSASLLMSVWCRQTRDAVIGLFAIGGFMYGIWLLMNWLGSWVPAIAGLSRLAGYFDPMHVAEPVFAGAAPREIYACLIGSWIAWAILGLPCFAVAVWRLRAAYMRQLEHSGKRSIGEWIVPTRAPVNNEPMLWKERHVEGVAPLSIFKMIPRWFALPAIAMSTTLLIIYLLAYSSGHPFTTVLKWLVTLDISTMHDSIAGLRDKEFAFFLLGAIVLVLASLVVGVRCSGAISGEREKETWEALLLTPMTSKQLIRSKLWGILGAAAPYVLAYMLPALLLATLISRPEAWILMGVVGGITLLLAVVFRSKLDSFATFWVFFIISLITVAGAMILRQGTLLLAMLTAVLTTVAMFYMGAAGVWSSTRSRSSWRALLSTMGIGYVGGLILWLVTLPITAIVGIILMIIFLILVEIDKQAGTGTASAFGRFTNFYVITVLASAIVLAGTFLGVPWYFINNAEKRVAEQERVRVWREEDLRVTGKRRRRYRKLKVR